MGSFWERFSTFKEADKAWERKKEEAAQKHPLKVLHTLPKMEGITKETKKGLKWKGLWWLLSKDKQAAILLKLLKHPFLYTVRLARSLWKKCSFTREGDFFYYGLSSEQEFLSYLQDPKAIFVLGFSYCHKPFECPSGRFSDECIHDPENPVCSQCTIGKMINACPETNTYKLIIPTVHYVGEKIIDIVHEHPGKKVIFLITACEMTLTMFADYGNMAGVKGIGVRLDGRICNTMKAFELSERGIKPGLTCILSLTEKKMLHFLEKRAQLFAR